jgi:imidazolonepropionase-like amidohydrolase
MFISCSSERKILEIEENGAAVIAGYWSPEQKSYSPVPVLLEWKDRKVNSLKPLNDLKIHSGEVYQWHSYILMPGYLDAHVHLALDSIDFFQCLENWNKPLLIEDNMKEFLRRYLEMGIVAIRDGGDLPGFSWLAKNRVQEQVWLGPQVLSVHEAVSRKGMYGRFLGRGYKDTLDWHETERDFFAQGIDQFKIIVTGIIRFDQYGVVGPTQWTVEELKELVEAAHQRGKKVMAHASGEEGISVAIAAGVDSIEHGYYITTEHLKWMREKDIAWVPTVAPIGNILKYPSERYSPHEVETLKRILKTQLAQIYEAYRLKVRLGVGTDAGAYQVPHAEAFYDEMSWMIEAGIPRLDVCRMATRENARIFGLTEFGRLEIGTPLSQLQLVNCIL